MEWTAVAPDARRHQVDGSAGDKAGSQVAGSAGKSAQFPWGGVIGVAAAALPMAALWGFTVDDALVSARVAANLASGAGYRFNAAGPVVDAVTPLGWAVVLAPFAGGGPLSALFAAQCLGALCWVAAAGWLGTRIGQIGASRWRFLPLLVLAVNAPVAAWAVAGMETGVVTALCTVALSARWWGALAVGLAAAWRPELIPYAVVLAAGLARASGRSRAVVSLHGALAITPAVAVGAVRALVFGSVAPLAVLAKPSDLSHGSFYVAAALIWTGVPVLVVAPWTLRRLPKRHLVPLVAFVAHGVAVVLAGGDWMSMFRLVAPVLPALLLTAAAVAEQGPIRATVARLVLGFAVSVVLLTDLGPGARTVSHNRRALIHSAAKELVGAERVAAVDVGWVGAATTAAVIDLSGITDPTVAVLPGGHTSKRIDDDFLRRRRVDHVMLLMPPGATLQSPWYRSTFSYAVEREVVAQSRALGLRPVAQFPVGQTGRTYLLLQMR